ncbi:MAG: SRPBCC domain-containing protein [Woeseiaceae bacterium]|nr:SRPBCC domain-containing protein [Woeseiaceae bacterium]
MKLPFLKSVPGEDPVVVEGVFNTSATRLFRAWTTPDEIVRWFGPGDTPLLSARVDPRKGGLWEFAYSERDGVQDVMSGEYVLVVQDEQLIFTWRHERRFSSGNVETTSPSLVTVIFEDANGGARLRLRHERIVREGGRLGVGDGWSRSFSKLQRLVEDLAVDRQGNGPSGKASRR